MLLVIVFEGYDAVATDLDAAVGELVADALDLVSVGIGFDVHVTQLDRGDARTREFRTDIGTLNSRYVKLWTPISYCPPDPPEEELIRFLRDWRRYSV